MKKVLFLFASLLILASCGKKPTSSFVADKSEINAGESVSFTNTSMDAVYFHWKFGDGTESREVNPLHTFVDGGNYNVLLHVSNKGGDYWDDSYYTVRVNGYYSIFNGNWGIAENFTTDSCGSDTQAYTLTITNGSGAQDVLITNLGNAFNSNIKGHSPHGAPEKIEIEDYNIQSKSGEYYNITGTIILTGSIMDINYTLSPAGTTTCGIVTGDGNGIKM